MLQPPPKPACEICNEFAVFSQITAPHNFLVRTSTFKDIHTCLEVHQYICSRCGEEWLHATSGDNAGWSLRRSISPNSYQLEMIVERRRHPRPLPPRR